MLAPRRRFAVAAGIILILLSPPRGVGGRSPNNPARSPCDIHYPSDDRIEWECHRLQAGESLETLFGKRWRDGARFNRIDRRHVRAGVALKIPVRIEEVVDFTPMPATDPTAAGKARFIRLDLSEQFLGAYEYGRRVFSAPVTSGERQAATPTGSFRITAAFRRHQSSLYTVQETNQPYPMDFALRFHVDRAGVAYYIHGRDLPGRPVSHGCIGLYDEAMQRRVYGRPRQPVLDDARKLYEWVIASRPDTGRFDPLTDGPELLIVGEPPGSETTEPQ